MREFSIYVHIPFCISKCNYCDFNSYVNIDNMIDRYIDKVISDIIQDRNFTQNDICKTIYIGGGTPSYIDSKHIVKILNEMYKKYNIDKSVEITIEQNPSTMNEKKLKDYYAIGINRLSIGLQSTNNELLNIIGRKHTYEMFLDKYTLARKIGFDNINVDLMIGLPNETLQNVYEDISNIVKIEPQHISCYSLILYDSVPLYRLIKEGKYKLPNDNLERDMYHNVEYILKQNGYFQYEISNFSKKDEYSRHNIMCWKQFEYIGFGAGAHSFIGNTRFCNSDNIEQYIDNNQISVLETMDKNQLMKEYMILGMRLINSFDIERFEKLYNVSIFEQFKVQLEYLIENEYVQILDNNKILLTR